MKQNNVLTCAGGGGSLEGYPYREPSDCTTNLTKTLAGSRTTTNVMLNLFQHLSHNALPDRSRNKFGMTVACRRVAFTMAEILLSLTIIGVVAAITLPSLTGNINERTWNTQRKALYARFSQAIALMPALNGYGTLTENESGSVTADTAAETFVTDGLSKVLKINNICDSDHLADCGLPSKVIGLSGSIAFTEFPKTLVDYNNMFSGSIIAPSDGAEYAYHQTNTKTAAFESANGESIAVFYNPNCKSYMNEADYHYSQTKMCANFVYDLNGTKGPNTFGKDIGFITAMYSTDSVVVAPMPILQEGTANHNGALALCKTMDSETRLPSNDELAAMFYNNALLNITGVVYSGTLVMDGNIQNVWRLEFENGIRYRQTRNNPLKVRCVKR